MPVRLRSRLQVLVLPLVIVMLVGHVSAGEIEANDYVTLLSGAGKLEIVRHPPADDYSELYGSGKMTSLPSYNPKSRKPYKVDLRSWDLSGLDVRDRFRDLIQATFDSKTVWPAQLPPGFDVGRIMEFGKNPGLGLRAVHRQGITGQGVGVAIIDATLLVDHVEYKDQLRVYEEIHLPRGARAQMHGLAVASIAVGKTVGVAPDADLYYIAESPVREDPSGLGAFFDLDLGVVAQSIDRLVAINKTLPRERRIRVISMSLGVVPMMKGYGLAKPALDRAAKDGIYAVYVGSDPFDGLAREPLLDPNPFDSYVPRHLPAPSSTSNDNVSAMLRLVPLLGAFADSRRSRLLVPRDSRCTASPTGDSDYVFYRTGGPSWTVPWIAGLYALACQVKPDVTPEVFWETARTTSVVGRAKRDGEDVEFGRIISPVALLDALQSQAASAVQ